MKEIREFGKVNGYYQLYGKITPNDYNLALCKLYGIEPSTIKGLNNKFKNK